MDEFSFVTDDIEEFRRKLDTVKNASGEEYAASLDELFTLSLLAFKLDKSGQTGQNDWRNFMNLLAETIEQFALHADEEKSNDDVAVLHNLLKNRYSAMLSILEDSRARKLKRNREKDEGEEWKR